MTQAEKDANLMIVAAVDGYAANHGLKPQEVFRIFRKYDVFQALRSCYGVLHTQSLDESAAFAEDYIARQSAVGIPEVHLS